MHKFTRDAAPQSHFTRNFTYTRALMDPSSVNLQGKPPPEHVFHEFARKSALQCSLPHEFGGKAPSRAPSSVTHNGGQQREEEKEPKEEHDATAPPDVGRARHRRTPGQEAEEACGGKRAAKVEYPVGGNLPHGV